jgi:hypothetical protein
LTTKHLKSPPLQEEAPEQAEARGPVGSPSFPALPIKIGNWIVTKDGVDFVGWSGPIGGYPIARERLLKLHHTGAGVGEWPVHLALKGWAGEADDLVDVFDAAMRVHHPAETVIDVAATRRAARNAARRARSAATDPSWGHDPGEAMLRITDRAQEEAAIPPEPDDWTDTYDPQHRALLRKRGAHPESHRNARDYNEHVIQLVASGLSGAPRSTLPPRWRGIT